MTSRRQLRGAVRRATDAGRAWRRWAATPRTERPAHRLVVNSLPKAGTTLAVKCLDQLTGTTVVRHGLTGRRVPDVGATGIPIGVDWPVRTSPAALRRRLLLVPPGSITVAHAPWSHALDELLEALDVRVVVVLRDPRAVAASFPPYVLGHPEHFAHARLTAAAPEDRLRLSVEGFPADGDRPGLRPLRQRLEDVVAWRRSPVALMVRFEDLVGAAGGGDDERQRAAVAAMARHVGSSIEPDDVERIAGSLFGGTATFRRGRVDGWRVEHGDTLDAMVREELGGLLADLGYD